MELLLAINHFSVPASRDIRKYFNSPYCESAKVGNGEVKRCYKVIEVTDEQKTDNHN